MTSQDTDPVGQDGNGVVNGSNATADPGPSQTATEYINSQLKLEADAREVLPFSFDHCTQPLGPLRQNLFSCLTCNPPPESPSDPYQPASVCYSCSIACHGEHTLVELFHRRNFTCDCGTRRLPATSTCNLRINPTTGTKAPVHSEEAATGNTYNHNNRNRFCECEELYDPHQEKGTMFQCLGLKNEDEGGCGEDWWHPECVVWGGEEGSRRRKEADARRQSSKGKSRQEGDNEEEFEENELPPGFPTDDDFETFICHKCMDALPLLKAYGGTDGFLPALALRKAGEPSKDPTQGEGDFTTQALSGESLEAPPDQVNGRKRSAVDAELEDESLAKKAKEEAPAVAEAETKPPVVGAYHTTLPPAPDASISLFCKEDFRDQLCRCKECYPQLAHFPQLLEEEETYEPPVSQSGDAQEGSASVGSRSIYERGEEALSSVDRVRAIEGVMAYNHMKDKVKSFLKPYAESGQAVSAEDIKAYFEKLRGDEQGINQAGDSAAAASNGESGDGEDKRKEQSGY